MEVSLYRTSHDLFPLLTATSANRLGQYSTSDVLVKQIVPILK
jgi:hypothetical protein